MREAQQRVTHSPHSGWCTTRFLGSLKLLNGFLRLTRFSMGALGVLAFEGGLLGSTAGLSLGEQIWISAAIWLLFAGGFALNDWHDIERDRVNKPKRPLVTGVIAERSALLLAPSRLCLGQ